MLCSIIRNLVPDDYFAPSFLQFDILLTALLVSLRFNSLSFLGVSRTFHFIGHGN